MNKRGFMDTVVMPIVVVVALVGMVILVLGAGSGVNRLYELADESKINAPVLIQEIKDLDAGLEKYELYGSGKLTAEEERKVRNTLAKAINYETQKGKISWPNLVDLYVDLKKEMSSELIQSAKSKLENEKKLVRFQEVVDSQAESGRFAAE